MQENGTKRYLNLKLLEIRNSFQTRKNLWGLLYRYNNPTVASVGTSQKLIWNF